MSFRTTFGLFEVLKIKEFDLSSNMFTKRLIDEVPFSLTNLKFKFFD